MAPANPRNSSGKTRIAEERTKHDWSQRELAERSGVSFGTVKSLEQRRIESPALRDYVAIAETLGVTVDDLIEPEWRGAPDLVQRKATGHPPGHSAPDL